jgi:predicted CXXCH cytochrome family protein
MTAHPPRSQGRGIWLLGGLALVVVAGGSLYLYWANATRSQRLIPPPVSAPPLPPMMLAQGRQLTVWWDSLPAEILDRSMPAGEESNIQPTDYLGPQACQQCHPANYELWSKHPHRWMNALADPATIQGDFSKGAAISYRGGRATFSHEGDHFFMRLQRGGTKRTYRITQTIGSRFFQYYVGRQSEGPEAKNHHFYHKDHVLPFGYWLEQKEWVPVIHIGSEVVDRDRPDPFAPVESGPHYAEYSASCNSCHTTFPLADMLGRRTRQMGEYAPASMHWSMRGYLQSAHPDLIDAASGMLKMEKGVENPMHHWEAPHYAATLGVSCEACHLGGRQHVESKGRIRPKFFPASPHLRIESKETPATGRTHDNLNWACSRCHGGSRPHFAAGMSTWNSVEYSDAMRGSCYSKLRCVDCHNPHRALGPKWSQSEDKDDALCMKCHQKYQPEKERVAHTHHPLGSAGARCMNCHMPKINEGVQDVVRTHTIYSPTRADMIEANHPNACNLCHTDKPIVWTLGSLKKLFGKTYNEIVIAANYPDRG